MNASQTPDEALATLASKIRRTDSETVLLTHATGRILAEAITADRDSPAADVSAMDGYAIHMTDLTSAEPIAVTGESVPGHAPPTAASAAMRVFTGGIVPHEFDLVVKREDTQEHDSTIRLLPTALKYKQGQHIRRQGENAVVGSPILEPGTTMHAGMIAAAANFGANEISVAKPIRITIIVTGDELHGVEADVQPWQLRDSNGPTLASLLAGRPWLEVIHLARVVDQKDELQKTLANAIANSDAVVLTGGVSMGDYDYVPGAIKAVGGDVVFHRLPIRPGKPILGAATPDGKPIIGLPGNPVSAAVGCIRFVLPLLAFKAGCNQLISNRPKITLDDHDEKSIPLHWYRLVEINAAGNASLVQSQGSGDLVSLARSAGFIEMPPGENGSGPWSFWSWSS